MLFWISLIGGLALILYVWVGILIAGFSLMDVSGSMVPRMNWRIALKIVVAWLPALWVRRVRTWVTTP